jgi:uncharacterized delta-60 repeat protein
MVASSRPSAAADGDLDLTFGGTGKVITDFGGSIPSEGWSVATQVDGKIVVAGHSRQGSTPNFALARYNIDGSLDANFGGSGKVTTSLGDGTAVGHSLAVQMDGKLVVAGLARVGGNIDFAVVRYNANGSLDTSFNGNGTVTTGVSSQNTEDSATGVALQSDGKIVAVGHVVTSTDQNGSPRSDLAIVRYNANGSLDTTFNGTGKVIKDFGSVGDIGRSVAIQTDGKILVAGSFGLARFDVDGSLDLNFNSTGTSPGVNSPGSELRDLALQNDGNIVVVSDYYVFRYNADGSYATGFSWDGSYNFLNRSVALQDDGKIVVAGSTFSSGNDDFVLTRYDADGSFDTTFNGSGKVITAVGFNGDNAQSVAVSADGNIVVAGYASNVSNSKTDFAVVRYVATPEPTSAVLVFGGAAILALRRRRI